jgi:peptidoglycan-N-acetylglucosamine deacetylase
MTPVSPHYYRAGKKSLFRLLRKDRYFIKTPGWIKKLYPQCVWDIDPKEKALYISFDDGPHPTITPFVLDLLKKYNAKATFFCIGENVSRYPEIYNQLIEAGHSIGNHTQHHLSGWKTADEVYVKNVDEAAGLIRSDLFRPPHGRIKKSQIKLLKAKYPAIKIIMWNILTGDWDENLKPTKCFEQIRRKISDGDIIVFHDTNKALARLEYALPKLLEEYSKQGYQFKKIPG